MARLIDADALMKSIKSFRWFGVPNTLKLMFDYLKIIINEQPTIEATPVVHGRWVLVKPRRAGRNATYKCTACGQLRSSYYNDVTQWKHCPCGARMDGDHET